MTKLDTQAIYKMLEEINEATEELETCLPDGNAPLDFIIRQVESIQQMVATHENAAAEPTDPDRALECECGETHHPKKDIFICPNNGDHFMWDEGGYWEFFK